MATAAGTGPTVMEKKLPGNRVALPGKRLAPGGYRVTITARDAAGNQTVKSVSFTVAKKTN